MNDVQAQNYTQIIFTTGRSFFSPLILLLCLKTWCISPYNYIANPAIF